MSEGKDAFVMVTYTRSEHEFPRSVVVTRTGDKLHFHTEILDFTLGIGQLEELLAWNRYEIQS